MITVLVHDGKADAYEAVLESSGLTYKRLKSLKNFFLVDAPESHEIFKDANVRSAEDPVMSLAQDINLDGSVKYDGPNPTQPWPLLNLTRRNPYGDSQRAGTTVNETYSTKRTGKNVDIYMFDSGIIHFCSDYAGRTANLDGSTDTYFGTVDEQEAFGIRVMQHGSWCASHAVGNTLGVARDAFVWSIPIIITQPLPGIVSYGLLAQGVDDVLTHYNSRAHLNRPAVVNMSIGGPSSYETYTELLRQLTEAGITVVAAAGNAATDMDVEGEDWGPSESYPHIIVAGALDYRRQPMHLEGIGGTNTGTAVTVYAPGQWVMGLGGDENGNDLPDIISGTSFATPYTTGVVACMLEGYDRPTSELQVIAIKNKLIENSLKDLITTPRPETYNIVHNRITYLDPTIDFEEIPLLTRNAD